MPPPRRAARPEPLLWGEIARCPEGKPRRAARHRAGQATSELPGRARPQEGSSPPRPRRPRSPSPPRRALAAAGGQHAAVPAPPPRPSRRCRHIPLPSARLPPPARPSPALSLVESRERQRRWAMEPELARRRRPMAGRGCRPCPSRPGVGAARCHSQAGRRGEWMVLVAAAGRRRGQEPEPATSVSPLRHPTPSGRLCLRRAPPPTARSRQRCTM